MRDPEREARAAARKRTATLHRTQLAPVEHDLDPVNGAAAISLVDRLTRESWAAAGLTIPQYARAEISIRFIPGRAHD